MKKTQKVVFIYLCIKNTCNNNNKTKRGQEFERKKSGWEPWGELEEKKMGRNDIIIFSFLKSKNKNKQN